MCLSCCWEAVALGGADPGRTVRLGEGLPPTAQSSPLPAAVTLAAMFAPLGFLGPFLPRQAEVTPRSGRDPQGAAGGPQRARSCALGLFGSHAALQLRSRTVAFRGDLFGAGSDLEIEFPAAWEANSSHLRLVAGARGGRRLRCDMKVKAAA